MRLNFHVQGNGYPLVILHGLLGSSGNWRAMSRRLADHFKVYCLDLRNHGASPHSRIMDYAAMADDLREFFANENISRGHLLGHSMGGKVAMQFTADNSQSVIKLVVVDIAPKEYPPMHMPVLAALRGLHLADYTSFGDIDRALERQIPEAPLRQFLLKNLARRTDQRFYWHIGLDEIIAGYNDLNRAVAINRIVANPACFIRAGRSGYIADADVPAIHAMFPNAQIVTFAESSHWVHIDVAQEFYESVTEFLLDTLR